MKWIQFVLSTILASSAALAAETGKVFPAYPVPDEIIETPVTHSVLMYGGVHAAAYQNTGIPGMMLGMSFFLRDFFAARAEIIVPLKKSELDGVYAGRVSDLTRNEPVLLRAGGNLRLAKFSAFYVYAPGLAGFEINRNNDENASAQTFVELGVGLQAFISGLYFAQLEYTYHFSHIPLRSAYYLDHNFHAGSLSFGIFF